MTGPTLWIAELETARYSFRAAGLTEADALTNMRRAWGRHRRQYGPEGIAPFSDYDDAVVTWEATPGVMTRDHSPLRATPRGSAS